MQFSITQQELLRGLQAVTGAVAKGTSLPVLMHIRIDASKAGVRLRATDLDHTVTVFMSAEVSKEGAGTLPAKELLGIVQTLEDAPVTFKGNGSRIGLSCGFSKFSLLGAPEEDFPSFPEIDFAHSWKIQAADFHSLLEHTMFAAAKTDTRPLLQGVLWEIQPDQNVMVATNGHRLARMIQPSSAGSSREGKFTLFRKTLDLVKRLFDANDELEVASSDRNIAFRTETRTVTSRVVEGTYPNYEQVIPKDNDKEAVVARTQLEAVVRRMKAVASANQTHRVRLAFRRDQLNLDVEAEIGAGEDQLSVEYSGEDIEIGFNAEYLLEAIRNVPDDDIKITMKAPERAATFAPAGGSPDYLCLVMPLRLLD